VKWIFLLALFIGTPALAGLLRSQPRYIVQTCFVLGATMFFLAPRLWAAPVAWPLWPGLARGIEISFVDAISIALIASTKSVRIPLSLKLAFGIYCLGVLVSTFVAYQWIPATFYAWQLFRTVLLFVAVARVCATVEEAPVALLSGLGAGLMIEAIYIIYQYLTSSPRPGGSLGHPNFIGLSLDFVVFPVVALLLGTRRTYWPAATAAAGLIIAVLGGSRATMGLVAIGVILTVILSLYQQKTSRKNAFAGMLAMLLIASAPAMLWAANRRTEAAKASSDYERSAMKRAARMIISDHPFGVGANQYVLVANTGGYSQRAGVAWNVDNRAAAVHSTYFLVTAEMGFLGLAGFVATLLSIMALGFRLMRRHVPGEYGELVPGLLATMIVAVAHISYEFVFMDFVLHYLFAISAGLLVAIAARSRSAAKVGAARAVPGGALAQAG
jgi:O-antigen ligase